MVSYRRSTQDTGTSTKALIPGNSQRARLVALNVFGRFATSEIPALTSVSTRRLPKVGAILDKHCAKRGETSLLSLLWYLLGRSSNTACLLKSQIAVYPGRCIFIHFKRMRSSSYRSEFPRCSKGDHQLTLGLSSHSFRRVAAQNANGNSEVNIPWIMDRGGWSMTYISKAFNPIVSTSPEDQHVGKVLAGCDAESKPCLPTLRLFDPVASDGRAALQRHVKSRR
ncbi:hypothetical protein PHMEG_00023324 [Phytophthora megakarya]|uniref:Uncharacterized protein n=1 Tax=Phytophthora megakarya TaxID=4795 RepID=A0A225VGI0_9STRA|nr:hypothetical protein PHMEG_00023324 [Phytophthora megakarya]